MRLPLFVGFCVLMLVLTMSSALAFGPRTHVQLLDEACSDTSWSSPDKQLCCSEAKDACMFGMLETDRDVFKYVTDFKKYQVDHSWSTASNCFNQASGDRRARAVCVGLTVHLAHDGVSHNLFIPDQVKAWGFVGEPLTHIVGESSIDDRYSSVQAEATSYLSDSNIQTYCKDPNNLLSRSTGDNMDCGALGNCCDALAGAVSKGGVYQTVFLAGPVMNWAYQGFISFSGLFPTLDWAPYHDRAIEMTKNALMDNYPIPSDKEYDPTGYERLDLANFVPKLLLTIFIILAIIAIIGIIIWKVVLRR